jgi:hypothetical protein
MSVPRRLLISVAGTIGACAIAIPAAVGLANNPSFSERIPVRVPQQAHHISWDDHGKAVESEPRHAAGADDNQGRRQAEPGDDRGANRRADNAHDQNEARGGAAETETETVHHHRRGSTQQGGGTTGSAGGQNTSGGGNEAGDDHGGGGRRHDG